MDIIPIDSNSSESPIALFLINNVVYGVSSEHVLSIEILRETTPIVDAPSYCRGIVDFRGDMISVVDMRALFGLGRQWDETDNGESGEQREMMLALTVNDKHVGIVVDAIVSVEYITDYVSTPGGKDSNKYVRTLARRQKDNSTVLMLNEELIVGLV